MHGRGQYGRFTKNNTFSLLGWRGLVQQRFGGDETACKTWWGQMGAYHYDKFNYGNSPISLKCEHPGTPEEFLERWRAALDFTLDDLNELPF